MPEKIKVLIVNSDPHQKPLMEALFGGNTCHIGRGIRAQSLAIEEVIVSQKEYADYWALYYKERFRKTDSDYSAVIFYDPTRIDQKKKMITVIRRPDAKWHKIRFPRNGVKPNQTILNNLRDEERCFDIFEDEIHNRTTSFTAGGSNDSDTFSGGRGDDVIVSTQGGTFQGDTGNDFILTYLSTGNLSSDNPVTMTSGEGHDVLIGSSVFWQAQDEFKGLKDFFLTSSSWAFDSGEGDDIIMPYVSTTKLSLNVQESINEFKQRVTQGKIYKPVVETNTIRDTRYYITTGPGQDIIALASKPAENVTTYIKDFDWNEDTFAFDNQEMADAVVPQLAWAKLAMTPTVRFDYKGHQYTLSNTQQNQMPIALKKTNVDNIEIQYPDLGEKIELSYDYALYNAKAVADKISTIEDPRQFNKALFDSAFIKKTFTKTYDITLDKNDFVTTKASLNLIPHPKGEFKVDLGEHLSNTVAPFRARDLFADENKKTCAYQNLATDETLHFNSVGRQEIPEDVVAVVVVQENNNGLVFTTKSLKDGLTLHSSMDKQSTQIFTASDFFTKGHFAKIGDVDDQNRSVRMNIGLVYQDGNDTLGTTPLSDPIQVQVRK